MGVLSGNPKDEPLHYGEIFAIWEASTMAKGLVSSYNALKFHTGDMDLRAILEDCIQQAQLEISELDEILIANGITPTPKPPERPEAKLEEIPVGARFADLEIAAILSTNLAAGLVAASTAMGLSIREDVGALFGKYHVTKAALGVTMLRLSKEKGWLIPPPLQIKRPEAVGV
ncbi:DUF3231 family protein [Paenibacillus sacheonensis]|uniref:DUF3231 family protein n=1 Tax=Paenibacillus sacheonensis TaxID=742054 RepID=A0A7X4YMQ4_9BACL|nr:DUF3231 family protein [Paenibacillus sacheonensis]MBM7568755.1 hypothetical protein [Paenibacillus sacheonensis]NBC68406.1 DUF3231 family protein [Paenibacillus sacheonensis]